MANFLGVFATLLLSEKKTRPTKTPNRICKNAGQRLKHGMLRQHLRWAGFIDEATWICWKAHSKQPPLPLLHFGSPTKGRHRAKTDNQVSRFRPPQWGVLIFKSGPVRTWKSKAITVGAGPLKAFRIPDKDITPEVISSNGQVMFKS